jgi:para-nitrobenzyl esterase
MRATIAVASAGLALTGFAAQAQTETPAATPIRYICDHSQSVTVTFEGDKALLDTGKDKILLDQRPVASGYEYTGAEHSIRGKGHEMSWIAPDGSKYSCREEDWAMRQPQVEPPGSILVDTDWTLVSFQSSDDAIGTVTPSDPVRYTLAFDAGGRLAMQLDCNRGMGKWQVTSLSERGGSLEITGGAMTRAACPPGSMDTKISGDLSRIRSFVLNGDRLFLSLEADAGTYEFRRN